MKKSLRILNASHADQYKKVLSRSFAHAVGFTTRPEASLWSHTEGYYPTLGAFHDDQLVSVMRLEWVHTRRELIYKLSTNISFPQVQFPAAYLAKAATLPQMRSGGFNSLLRYHCLKIAIGWGASSMFGTMVEGSPRVFSMMEMGYEFVKNPIKWNGHFISDKTPLIGHLDLQNKGDQALKYLEKNFGQLINAYTLEFDAKNILMKDDKDVRFPWSA